MTFLRNTIDHETPPSNSNSLSSRMRPVVKGSRKLYKHRRLLRRERYAFSSIHAKALGRIVLLYCCMMHNIQHSNSLNIRNIARIQHASSTSTLSSPMRTSRRIRHSSILSSISNKMSEQTDAAAAESPSSSASSGAKHHDKPPSAGGGQSQRSSGPEYYINRNNNKRNNNNNQQRSGYHNRKLYNGRDFRTHEDQQRVQLDWMVRNTAKVLGADAPRTLRFVFCAVLSK